MIGKKKTDIDHFIAKLWAHPAMQTPFRKRVVDDFETVLEALFLSDNARAIEISDEIRGVIDRTRVSLERRIALIQRILEAGGVDLP